MTQDVQVTNEFYGGLNVMRSKIIFPNGSIYPQHTLAIMKPIDEDLSAVLIEGNITVTSQ